MRSHGRVVSRFKNLAQRSLDVGNASKYVKHASRWLWSRDGTVHSPEKTADELHGGFGETARRFGNSVWKRMSDLYGHIVGKGVRHQNVAGGYAPHGPNEDIERVAADYINRNHRQLGLRKTKGRARHEMPIFGVDEAAAKAIANYHDTSSHEPDHPVVRSSYEALKKEVMGQYQALADNGYKIEPWRQHGQPYQNSHAMLEDLKHNKHLYFFPTDTGFGQIEQSHHPLLERVSGIKGVECYNDLLRAVHDIMGHGAGGHQFGPAGEENAWREHSRMFSRTARPALTCETRCQNSWVNFGPHLRRKDDSLPKKGEEGYIHATERPYSEQTVYLPPKHFWDDTVTPAQRPVYRAIQKALRLVVLRPQGVF